MHCDAMRQILSLGFESLSVRARHPSRALTIRRNQLSGDDLDRLAGLELKVRRLRKRE